MNWGERPHRSRLLGLLVGIAGGPPAVIAAYLTFALWVVPVGGAGLASAVLFGVTVGLACIARLPEPVTVRVILAVIYVPAACSWLLVLWALADELSYGA